MLKLLRMFTGSMFFMVCLLAYIPQAHAHALDISDSNWYINEHQIVTTMTIGQNLILNLGPVDDNNDKQLSPEEFQKAATSYVEPYLLKKLSVEADGKALPATLNYIQMSDLGTADVKMTFSSKEPIHRVKITSHLFYEMIPGFTSLANITLPNASEVLEVPFTSANPVWEHSLSNETSVRSAINRFIALGVEHIFSGYDHVLFLIVLTVVGLRFKEVLGVISSFTVAHSITLTFAALEVLKLNSRFVESMIAISICYIAVENIFRQNVKHRWLLSFGFGLIHGFGFASVLQQYTIVKTHLVYSLVAFNAGIEIGQIMIFLVFLPMLYVLKKRPYVLRKITLGVSTVVLGIGFLLFIERIWNVSILWF